MAEANSVSEMRKSSEVPSNSQPDGTDPSSEKNNSSCSAVKSDEASLASIANNVTANNGPSSGAAVSDTSVTPMETEASIEDKTDGSFCTGGSSVSKEVTVSPPNSFGTPARKKGWPRGRKRRCLPRDAPKGPLSGRYLTRPNIITCRVIPQLPSIVANYHSPVNSHIT